MKNFLRNIFGPAEKTPATAPAQAPAPAVVQDTPGQRLIAALKRQQAALDPAVLQKLIKACTTLEEKDSKGRTALAIAAGAGFLDIATTLLAAGADINARDLEQKTPLHLAINYGKGDLVRLLVEKNADLQAQSQDWYGSPIALACEKGQMETARFLLRQPAVRENLEGLYSARSALSERKEAMVEEGPGFFGDADACVAMSEEIGAVATNQKILIGEKERAEAVKQATADAGCVGLKAEIAIPKPVQPKTRAPRNGT